MFPSPIFAVDVPDWAAIAGAVVAILTGIAALVVALRKSGVETTVGLTDNEIRHRQENQKLEEREESFQVRQLKAMIVELRAQLTADSQQCENRIRQLQQEVKAIWESERQYYAESVRQAEVIRGLEKRVEELRQGASHLGIEIESREQPPLSDEDKASE